MLVGLDPRQRDQVVDQPLHPPRLARHDAQEARADRRLVGAVGILERLDEADQAGERRAQFVAGVGDEIDAHPLGRARRAMIAEPHQPRRLAERQHGQRPHPVRIAEPDQLDAAAGMAFAGEQVGRGRVADREADVVVDDMLAEHRDRRGIGAHHLPALDQQQRIVDRAEHVLDARPGRGGGRRDRGLGQPAALVGPHPRGPQQQREAHARQHARDQHQRFACRRDRERQSARPARAPP